jgi:hypothetical protein
VAPAEQELLGPDGRVGQAVGEPLGVVGVQQRDDRGPERGLRGPAGEPGERGALVGDQPARGHDRDHVAGVLHQRAEALAGGHALQGQGRLGGQGFEGLAGLLRDGPGGGQGEHAGELPVDHQGGQEYLVEAFDAGREPARRPRRVDPVGREPAPDERVGLEPAGGDDLDLALVRQRQAGDAVGGLPGLAEQAVGGLQGRVTDLVAGLGGDQPGARRRQGALVGDRLLVALEGRHQHVQHGRHRSQRDDVAGHVARVAAPRGQEPHHERDDPGRCTPCHPAPGPVQGRHEGDRVGEGERRLILPGLPDREQRHGVEQVDHRVRASPQVQPDGRGHQPAPPGHGQATGDG